jgi:hypothetical protein
LTTPADGARSAEHRQGARLRGEMVALSSSDAVLAVEARSVMEPEPTPPIVREATFSAISDQQHPWRDRASVT